MRVVAAAEFADDTATAGGFFRDDGDWAMSPHALDRFVQNGLCSFFTTCTPTVPRPKSEKTIIARIERGPKQRHALPS